MEEKKITRWQLEQARHRGNSVHGHFDAYCFLHSCCESCNRRIRFLCRLKDKITDLQEKIILRMCKGE